MDIIPRRNVDASLCHPLYSASRHVMSTIVVTGARGFERRGMTGMFAGGAEVVGLTGTARGRF